MENKNAEVSSIHIDRAENGYSYRVGVKAGDGCPDMHEYVYESVDDVLKAVKDDLESPHAREYPNKEKTKAAFHEVKENEPEVVSETRNKKGKKAARRQLVALALSKARAKGGLFKREK